MDMAETLYTTYRDEALRKDPGALLPPWSDLEGVRQRPFRTAEEVLKLSPAVAAEALNLLATAATRIATEHGFTDATVGEDVALIHSEASELLEDHRTGQDPKWVWYEEKVQVFDPDGALLRSKVAVAFPEPLDADGKLRKPCGIPSEAADIVIRVMHFCGKHGIDLGKAVREKMAYNASRPFKHGNKAL